MTRDAHFVAIDTEKRNMVCNRTKNPKVKSNEISTHIIGKYLDQGSAEKLQWHSL